MSKYQTFDAKEQLVFMKEITAKIDPNGTLELVPLIASEYKDKLDEMVSNLERINHGKYIGYEIYEHGLGDLTYYVLKFEAPLPARCDFDPRNMK